MGLVEILLIIIGVLAFVGSFVIPEKMSKEAKVEIPEEKINQLHSVANLGYDVGNEADDLTNEGREQDRNEHDKYHCYDRSERCNKVL